MENILNTVFEVLTEINEKDSSDFITVNNSIEDIVTIALTGSSLFTENPRDADLIVLVKNFKQERRVYVKFVEGKKYDMFIMDEEFFKGVLSYKNNMFLSLYNASFYLAQPIFGSFMFEYDIKQYEKQAKEIVLKFLNNSLFKEKEGLKLSKLQRTNLWWCYLTLKFLETTEYVITEEDKEKRNIIYSGIFTENEINYWKNVKNMLDENEEL
jgi:hypothetical protein